MSKNEGKTENKDIKQESNTQAVEPDESLVLSKPHKDKHGEYYYNRGGSPETESLSRMLLKCYGLDSKTAACMIVPSGMSAIHLAISETIACGNTKNIIAGSELYSGTWPAIRGIAAMAKQTPNLFEFDVTDQKGILQLFQTLRDQDNLLFLESASNPSGFMMDWDLVREIRKLSKSFILIVDNTWLSSSSFNPFEHGADVVVTSLTKYYSAGTAIAGAVLCKEKARLDRIWQHTRLLGLHVSPHNARCIINQLPTLKERISKSSATTVEVVKVLSEKGFRISHPNLEHHPSFHLIKKYIKHYPSVFTVLIPGKTKKIKALMRSMRDILEHKTSFGGAKHRSDSFPHQCGNDTLCRFAVGYDDCAETLIEAICAISQQASASS